MVDWKERYMREVEGLNNEGDPIGGDPPSGFRHVVDALKAENEAQAKRIAELEEDLQFVERWANHHGTKPNVTAQEALSCIQHYPSIAAITESYKDGVIPNTRNPYAEIEAQAKRIVLLEYDVKHLKDALRAYGDEDIDDDEG